MFRVVERFLGNSCYHFVTRISKHTDYQGGAQFVLGSEVPKNHKQKPNNAFTAYHLGQGTFLEVSYKAAMKKP
jgi:hypothetical protein